jgi:hypothetical protein
VTFWWRYGPEQRLLPQSFNVLNPDQIFALALIKDLMSHRIEFELKYRIDLLSFTGILTEASFVDGVSKALRFIKANGMEGAIFDFSEVEVAHVSMDFVRGWVHKRDIVAPEKPRVSVASHPAIFGMLRAFGALAELSGVFPLPVRTMAEAFDLLKLRSPVFGTEHWGAAIDKAIAVGK